MERKKMDIWTLANTNEENTSVADDEKEELANTKEENVTLADEGKEEKGSKKNIDKEKGMESHSVCLKKEQNKNEEKEMGRNEECDNEDEKNGHYTAHRAVVRSVSSY